MPWLSAVSAASGIPTATRPSHGHKCGRHFPPRNPAFSREQARSAFSPAPQPSHGNKRGQYFPPATRLSHGNKRGQYFPPATRPSHGHKRGQRRERNFHCAPAFSRAQARSAPRAHVRELLCETQSSKEQLRRSRTESSAAPPAIEELAGEARQVRPARAACGSVSTDLGLLTGGEVWRATGPPAPSSIKFSRKFSLPSPPRPHTAEVGKSRYGTPFFHPEHSAIDDSVVQRLLSYENTFAI